MEQPAYFPFKIRAIERDINGRLSTPALANMLQEAAWQHATKLGVSTYKLMEQGLTWVLSRFKIEMGQPLSNLQEITVKTWPAGAHGLRAYRGFRVFNHAGDLLASAETVWLIVDLKKKQVQPIPDYIKAFRTETEEGDFNFSASIPEITEAEYISNIKAGWFDLDINGHVNNNHYIKWLIECLPGEFLRSHWLNRLEIVYRAECFPDDRITSSSRAVAEGEFIHSLVKNESKELIRATTSWSAD